MELENQGKSAVDVNILMDRIRSRIEEKKQNGSYSPEELEKIERMTLQIQSDSDSQEGDIQYRLSQLNYLCDTRRPPELSSHRKTLGSLVSGVKKVILKLTGPYIQMVLKNQVEFNVELVRLLNQMALDSRFRWSSLEKQLANLEDKGEQMTRSLETIPQELKAQKNVFEEVLTRIKEIQNASTAGSPPLNHLLDRVREPEYVGFEDRHRGSEEAIKWKQKNYLPYFKDRGPVLDIGCGRGEFLELLKEAGIQAFGVDTNQEMVRHCRSKGLEADSGDGLTYLKGLSDQSLGGIFLSQVIEHLTPEVLRELVRVSFTKLRPGGLLLAETINPQCLSTFSGAFYLDLSHKNPIHPEAARYLWESLGFRQVELLYVSPFPEEMKLKEMVRREDDSYEDELGRILNENVRSLNALLYGFQDYAVLGYK
ncbi:MAG: class I SAM-dependent methyltransferase [Deltaproteobacteria bacterium]|nr:class I SAM-dependent methyltransferase [Deltaproteobacteria bacterium]